MQSGTAAVDLALVVPATHQNREDHLWLQILTSYADARLKELGIGQQSGERNRFCIVQYGGQGDAQGPRLLEYAGDAFLPYEDFYRVRRQLLRDGETADGYQAIDFALRHVPFRSQPNVTKMVVFVAHHRRTSLDSSITNETVESLLRARGSEGVVFATVVGANLTVLLSLGGGDGGPDHRPAPVMGITSHEQGIEPGVGFSYSLLNGESVSVSSHEVGVVQDYVNLTLDAGGVVWGVETPARDNVTAVKSLLSALFEENGLHQVESEEVCEQCWCEEGSTLEGGGGGCAAGEQVCQVDTDQQTCSCHLQLSPTEVC